MQPRPEVGARLEAAELFVGLQESLLDHVLGVRCDCRSSGAPAGRQRGCGAPRAPGKLRYLRRGPARRRRRPCAASELLRRELWRRVSRARRAQSSARRTSWRRSCRDPRWERLTPVGLSVAEDAAHPCRFRRAAPSMQACCVSCGTSVATPQNGQAPRALALLRSRSYWWFRAHRSQGGSTTVQARSAPAPPVRNRPQAAARMPFGQRRDRIC